MIVGFSGHQNLGSPDAEIWLRDGIRSELLARSFTTGISCLAAGGDQLFSQVVIDLGKDLEAIIPCKGYEATFSNVEDARRYRYLLGLTRRQHFESYESPSERAYYDAGKRVVDLSTIMFFAWDGKPARGLGGTADIVAYAREVSVPLVHFNVRTKTILS